MILYATKCKNDNTVFIGVLQCLAVLLCCELFVSANPIDNYTIFSRAATRSHMKCIYPKEKPKKTLEITEF